MYLIDTNIFLEILLNQKKKDKCKKFLLKNQSELNISDFSLYSIGIVLFREKLFDDYENFLQDILQNEFFLMSIPVEQHSEIMESSKKFNLDFDDSYQYSLAKSEDLKIVTMDKDFRNVKDIEIIFL